jgi:hypothetical protein
MPIGALARGALAPPLDPCESAGAPLQALPLPTWRGDDHCRQRPPAPRLSPGGWRGTSADVSCCSREHGLALLPLPERRIFLLPAKSTTAIGGGSMPGGPSMCRSRRAAIAASLSLHCSCNATTRSPHGRRGVPRRAAQAPHTKYSPCALTRVPLRVRCCARDLPHPLSRGAAPARAGGPSPSHCVLCRFSHDYRRQQPQPSAASPADSPMTA